ncbi:MAG: signal peptide peptidase SppA [Bacteroidales bacterium]|nr:signal peptide peptidase SppA [Bacteroidales bacterium]
MKQFFKFMFASLLGTLLTFFVIFLILFAMVAGIVASAESDDESIKPHSVLVVNWKSPIKDRSSDNPFEGFDFNTMESKKPVGLNDILETIEKAAGDPNIEGLFLDMESIPAGIATATEIRNKLLEFKESGKFIVSYANGYDQLAYYMATVSDEIYLHPDGMILFKGLSAQLMFFKGMLDKLDIEMQVVRGPNNKFKSAVEPLLLDKMSEANREQLQVLLNSIWGGFIQALSESRGISIADLNNIADKLEVTDAGKALELNFVDGLVFRDELLEKLKEKTGRGEDEKLLSVSFGKYTKAKDPNKKKISKNRIAVVYAQGGIVQGKSGPDQIGSSTIAKAIHDARTNDKVKAIVFRVNSGGGDALASEIIRREVELAKAEKPVIVSMGDYAASGGYWISTNADYIFAQPATITGSIGVFGVIPNFKGFLNNKLGITTENLMTNENANFIDVMEPMNDFQREKLNQEITKIYTNFIKLVATTRKLDEAYVDSIARGRVWTGTDGLDLGLVDELGGLGNAIAYAAEKAGLDNDYRLSEYPKQKEFIEQLVEELTGNMQARIIGDQLGEFKTYFHQVQAMQEMKSVQARLPFFITIN